MRSGSEEDDDVITRIVELVEKEEVDRILYLYTLVSQVSLTIIGIAVVIGSHSLCEVRMNEQ